MSDGSFAYGASAVVTSDGKELLVYDPSDEAPRWKKTLETDIAHVALDGARVLALDVAGNLTSFDASDGTEVDRVGLAAAPLAFAAWGGARAVAFAKEIVVLRDDATRLIAIENAHAVAFDGAKVAVGTEDGELIVVDESDTRTTEANIGGAAVRGICRHPKGFWLVCAGDKVFRVDDNGETEVVTRASGKAPSVISCSNDGRMIGIVLDARTAVAIAYPSRDTILSVTYPDRAPRRIDFVPGGRFVWVGLDLGDANKIDLDNEDVYRTDPHPGRPRNTWLINVGVERRARRGGDIPGPRSGAPSVPAMKSEEPPPEAKAPREEEELESSPTAEIREVRPPPSPPEQQRIVLGVLAVSVALALISLKCG
jgi:PQQ-like domain